MITFIIKYYQKKDEGLIEVTPDVAHIFRVFQHTGNSKKWVHDFSMLSRANEFIKSVQESERYLDRAFASIVAARQEIQPESVETVLESIKQDIIRRII
jgi:hypothetical protein